MKRLRKTSLLRNRQVRFGPVYAQRMHILETSGRRKLKGNRLIQAYLENGNHAVSSAGRCQYTMLS